MQDKNEPSTALLISPHLDDVAFSCGGIAATLAAAGWTVTVVTIFTRSVHPATGFALACQRDKNLPDDLDYMALRRDEDAAACRALGVRRLLLDWPEAPNRGYSNAAALFAPPRADDDTGPLARSLASLFAAERPALVLAPQGCGGHVDHIQTIAACLQARDTISEPPPFGFYRDTPYVIRDPSARPDRLIVTIAECPVAIPLDEAACGRKQQAVGCYRSQLAFQFGGAMQAAAAIEALMTREAEGSGAEHAERLLLSDPALLARFAA